MSKPLLEDIDEIGHPYGADESRGITREGKLDRSKIYPSHWGKPPAIQTRDIVKLPYGFGLAVASRIGLKKMCRWTANQNAVKEYDFDEFAVFLNLQFLFSNGMNVVSLD